jgi:pullulanase
MRVSGSITSVLRLALVACTSALLLAGCGGGGGEPPTPTPTPLPTPDPIPVPPPPQAAATIRVHYNRLARDAGSWGVYSWEGPAVPSATWITDRFMFSTDEAFGAFVDIPADITKTAMKFLVTDGSGNKNCGDDQSVTFAADIATKGQQIWLREGDCTIHATVPAISYGNLNEASAHWLSKNTLAWPGAASSGSYKLFYALAGGIGSSSTGVTGADGSIPLVIGGALSAQLKTQFPHLSGALALSIADSNVATVTDRLSAQFALAQYDASGALMRVTSLQTAGMLDALFATSAASSKLGVTFNAGGIPTFRLWAPTAKSVALNIYPDPSAAATSQRAMTLDRATGVWEYTAPDASLTNVAYYTYNVNVFSRWANNTVVSNTVTDPYSLSVSANSARSFVANLDSAALKPAGWDAQAIPPLAHPTDISLYELHIRDFSASDLTVPAAHRGKYLAFTDTASNGMKHLKSLQSAGLTHIHMLPSFDTASVNEAGCTTPVIASAAADSDTQQAAVAASENSDCFNWGYDPVHYTAPEGSFATNANDGAARVREFRSMVQALHAQGLRVTMDVVYNHTSSSQQNPLSILDKIVPSYYYRLNAKGGIVNDSCCADTAAENAMMAKLMVDSVATWASQYKVDSFRFDIMGMHPLAVITKLKTAVDTAAGRDIYLYGEAWNFGAVGNDARFVQARQSNMFGTGIGSFNDRLRDAVRGGGCCDSGPSLISQQGFINGVFTDPNATSTQNKDDALRLADLVRVGLSGTLREFAFTDRTGTLRKNSQIDYFGQNAGFAASPAETINYVEAHDNQTLFDYNAYKLPATTSLEERVRVQNLGAAINMFSQGVPFFHAGQEILRSKSMDRDSYNAGDWFNLLDFSYQSNNFGVGLPMNGVNGSNWSLMKPILANPLIKPDPAAIIGARDYFNDLLRIRKDSTLFRLRTAQDVMDRLSFFNTGPDQQAGLVVMSLNGDSPSLYAGAKYSRVVVLFNVDKVAKTIVIDQLKGRALALHTVQLASTGDTRARTATVDNATGTFNIPARTTVVFVQNAP